MRPNIIHSILTWLAAFALPALVACGSQEEILPDGTGAALYLEIGTVGRTGGGMPDNEKMNSVRIVVLHADGKVEHNRYYALDGAQTRHAVLLPVTPSEKKRVYLFANEESVASVEGSAGKEGMSLSDFMEHYRTGDVGFRRGIEDLYFTPDYSNGAPVPMSSMYEMEVPDKGLVKKTMYVVRVATKFTVNFRNWRGEEVTVNSFTIGKYADRNFLMAHVNSYPSADKYPTWMDWLKEVSEVSSEDDDYATTEAAGWLKDYELPEQADRTRTYTHGAVTVGLPTVDLDHPENSKPGVAENAPVFYLPESRNLKEGTTDGEQEYVLTFDIKGTAEPFVFPLPNLKALFRNTSVVVNVTFYKNMEIEVDVVPYSEVILDPVFGLSDD